MRKRLFITALLFLILGMTGTASALNDYLALFNSRYGTSATALNTCTLCHTSVPSLNPYGAAVLNSGFNFAAIEGQDSDGDGFTNIVEINARTFPGNAASKPAPSDTTAPTVTAFTVPATSTSLTVPITSFTATDNTGVTGYMVTETSTAPAAGAAGWSATPPTNRTFATAGAKTLFAWAKDAAGNVSTSRSASVTITIVTADTTAPIVTVFTLPATSSSLTVTISSFTATDNVGVTGYRVTESPTAPTAGAAGWSATAPTSFTFGAAGVKTLYAWAKDAAGNVSAGKSAAVTVTLPTGGSDIFPAPATPKGAVYSYAPVVTPVVNTNPADSRPLGVGAVATGGPTFNATVRTAAFAAPVDVYVILQMHSADPFKVYVMKPDKTFAPAVSGNIKPWKKGVRGPINESLFGSLPVTKMEPGRYMIGLLITPSGSLENYHYWMTGFVIPGEGDDDDENESRSSYRINKLPEQLGISFIYKPVAAPVVNTNPASAMPIGVGSLADGGSTLNITVGTGRFSKPADLYITLYMPAADPFNVYVMKPDKTFISTATLVVKEDSDDDKLRMERPAPWKTRVTAPLNESLFGALAASDIPDGVYRLGLLAAPSGKLEKYTYWMTTFWVQ